VSMTVNYLRGARGSSLRATARVVRRGASLCFCEVDVHDGSGDPVAQGLVTYKIG
jgi:acyl-coenzyme A thioesterase PaaI-like protein